MQLKDLTNYGVTQTSSMVFRRELPVTQWLPNQDQPMHANRHRFVRGLATGGVLTAMSPWLQAASRSGTDTGSAPVLSGQSLNLVIAETSVNFAGVARMATTINGSIPAQTLRLREGDEVTIRVTNRLSVPTSIQWHGILLPYQMDGVPAISFTGIAPGEAFTYRFTLRQSGTYWYYSHSGFQKMTGMYGAMIIELRSAERHAAGHDYIVQLTDWTDEDPIHAFSKLKVQSDTYNFNQPTYLDFVRDVSIVGLPVAMDKRRMWNQMRMNPTDLADLSASILTFLMGGTTSAGNWTATNQSDDRVRLRFINGSGNSFYDVRIPNLRLTVKQADGQEVEPVAVDEFCFGPGETDDVLVEPSDDAYTIIAQSMDRSGYACGTLATDHGLRAPTPATDPVESLTTADMMESMVHEEMDGMNDSGMDHSMHGKMASGRGADQALDLFAMPSPKANHAGTEYGASVDMRVNTPPTNLDDPGIGLPYDGGRVLTIDALRSVHGVLDDHRLPTREIELHLTGNIERYSWSFDGLEFGGSTSVSVRHKERVRVIFQNDTMMTHPMHLHGMWSELETNQGELRARRHTIPVQPAQRISFLTTPYDLGRWAWHCHLVLHMGAWKFREVVES